RGRARAGRARGRPHGAPGGGRGSARAGGKPQGRRADAPRGFRAGRTRGRAMKTRFAIARALLVVAAAAVPATAPSALGPRYGGALRVGVIELPSADPAPPRSADQRLFSTMVHATLVCPGPE